jgi:hypothetical protein
MPKEQAAKFRFARLFNLFVGKCAERIQKHSSGFFIGLGGFGKCALKPWVMSETGDPRHPSSLETQKNPVGNPPTLPSPPFREFKSG